MERSFEIASKLINIELNKIIERSAGNPKDLQTMAIRWSEYDAEGQRASLQPTHETIFYFIEDFLDICRTCGLSNYVDIQPNADGKLAPTLNIF